MGPGGKRTVVLSFDQHTLTVIIRRAVDMNEAGRMCRVKQGVMRDT